MVAVGSKAERASRAMSMAAIGPICVAGRAWHKARYCARPSMRCAAAIGARSQQRSSQRNFTTTTCARFVGAPPRASHGRAHRWPTPSCRPARTARVVAPSRRISRGGLSIRCFRRGRAARFPTSRSRLPNEAEEVQHALSSAPAPTPARGPLAGLDLVYRHGRDATMADLQSGSRRDRRARGAAEAPRLGRQNGRRRGATAPLARRASLMLNGTPLRRSAARALA